MTHRTPSTAALLLLAGVLAACSDGPTDAAPRAAGITLAQQVAALGFRADMIEDHGDFVLVEGDIYLSKAQLRTVTLPSAGTDPRSPSFQYRTTNLVTSANVRDIVVNLSGLSSQSAWQTAARDAMTHWNGTGSNVKMTEGATSADISVATTCTTSSVAAYASFPASGNVGPTIHVNTCFAYATSSAQKLHNMVHELGHTIGFRHSNYTQLGESAGTEGAVHVSGTPTSGNATGSVMNGGTALNSWAGFATSDLTAVRAIYPLSSLPAASVSVSNSGGQPLVSWGALSGASSYTVRLVTYNYSVYTNGSQVYHGSSYITVGTTTGTSVLDGARTYTGNTTCLIAERSDYSRYSDYFYEVIATFPTGTSTARRLAPVGECRFS